MTRGEPAQTSGATAWAAALAACRVVLVVAGGGVDPRRRKANGVTARVESPTDVDALRSALTLRLSADQVAWTETGEVTLALYGPGRDFLTTIEVLGQGWLRTPLLQYDQLIEDPESLDRWMLQHVPSTRSN